MTEISRSFSEYINRVAYRGEHFTVMRGKKPVAEIHPVSSGKSLGELKSILKSLPKLTMEELEQFEQDLDAIRKEGNQDMLESFFGKETHRRPQTIRLGFRNHP